jgi:hypothetical protein
MSQLIKSSKNVTDYLAFDENNPIGKLLKQLDLDEHPIQLRYAEHVSSCFTLPEKSYELTSVAK